MDPELTPEEQEQTQPSRTRFRDTAREISKMPKVGLTVAKDNPNREHALKKEELADAINTPGLKNKAIAAKDLAKSLPGKSIDAHNDNVRRGANLAKKVGAKKKWLIGGGGALAIIIPIMAFFAWMMLFKNVHIKNLYVTYRWAQFNRGINKSLKAQLKYAQDTPDAKINGSAETTIAPTDTPDEIMKKANASELGPESISPDDTTKIEAEAKKVTSLEQSIEGASEKTLKESGSTRSVAAAEGTGDTPDAKAESAKEKAKSNIDDELSKNKAIEKGAPESIKDGVDETKTQQEAGESPKKAAEKGATKVLEGGSRWGQVAQKAGGAFVVATFYCIFRDIYVSAKDQINEIALSGAIGVSQTTNKTADCQKNGECDSNQIGAMSEKYDNGEESFTETCGYARATQTSNPECEEIDPDFVIDGLGAKVGGETGTAITTADLLLDPPGPVDFACSVVMSPYTQTIATVAQLAAIAGTGGGWAAVGQSVAGGATAFAATSGGKALLASAILKFTGDTYKDLSPFDMGNLNDMGNLATASDSCSTAWCPQVTDEQLAQLDRDYRTERIAANSKRSVLEKFFDTSSPDSVTSRVVLNAPATPRAAMARIKTLFASITNPININTAIGRDTLAIAKPQSAYAAADNGASVYGLSNKMSAPPNLLTETSHADVVAWGKNRDLSSLEDKFKDCAGENAKAYHARVTENNTTCLWSNLNSDEKMFFQYKYAQNVAFKAALANNKQSNLTGGGVGSAVGSSENKSTSDLVGKATKGQPCPAGTTPAGDSKTFKGIEIGLCNVNGIIVNVSIAANVKNMIAAAKTDGVTLTGSSFRSYERQVQLRIEHGCPDPKTSPSACSPPTARPGTSRHEEGLAIDFQTYSFSWLAENAATYGLYNLPSESWHWSVDGN